VEGGGEDARVRLAGTLKLRKSGGKIRLLQ
jgi:hypothetical protein